MRVQRRYWLFERVGWTLLLLVIGAAAAGAFSGGPLSAATVAGAALSAHYERFARRGVDTRVTVTLSAHSTLRVQGADGFDVAAVEPRPAAVRGDRGGLAYDFAAGDGATTVTFRLTPRRWGMQHLRLAADAGAPATLDILVYP
jgi:hypothetical protein